jgi:hypothetical protein
MEVDEAVAIQKSVLRCIPVKPTEMREANRILRALRGAGGENHSWMPEPLSVAQRQRVNMVLAFKLAFACGLFDVWKDQPCMGQQT